VDAISQDELANRAKKYGDRTERDVFQEMIAHLQGETLDLTPRLFFVHAQEAIACGNIFEQLNFFERKLCSGLGFTNLVRYTCSNLSPFIVKATPTTSTTATRHRSSTSSFDSTLPVMSSNVVGIDDITLHEQEEMIEYVSNGAEELSANLEAEERKEERGERLRFIVHLAHVLLENGEVDYDKSVCPPPVRVANILLTNNDTQVILKVAYCRFLLRVGKTALVPLYASSLPTEPRVAFLSATL
jgi:hypothetical protein